MNPQIKTALFHIGTGFGVAVAVLGFAATHSVDLYAFWNQFNTVVVEVTKLVAMGLALCTGIKSVMRTSPENRITELSSDPKAVEIARNMPVTPQLEALGDALKKNGS